MDSKGCGQTANFRVKSYEVIMTHGTAVYLDRIGNKPICVITQACVHVLNFLRYGIEVSEKRMFIGYCLL